MPRLSPSTKGCRKNTSCASLSTKFQFWIGLGDDGQFKMTTSNEIQGQNFKECTVRNMKLKLVANIEAFEIIKWLNTRINSVARSQTSFCEFLSWNHFLPAVSKMFFLLLVVSFVVSVARGRAINSVPRITEEQVNNSLLRSTPSLTRFVFPFENFWSANNKFRIRIGWKTQGCGRRMVTCESRWSAAAVWW